MLDSLDYFSTPRLPDAEREQASAGWMDMMSAEGALLGGSDLRRAFIRGERLNIRRFGNVFRTFPRTEFNAGNKDAIRKELAEFICQDQPDATTTSFANSVEEIMQNCIEHSGTSRGTVAAARTSYNATVFIRDEGVGLFKNFKEVLGRAEPGSCPPEQFDARAIDLAITATCTARGAGNEDNAGMGLPLFLASAEQAIIVSGRGRRLKQHKHADVPPGVLKTRFETGKAFLSDPNYQGVAVEGYFNLDMIGTRIANYTPPTDDELEEKFRDLLGSPDLARGIRKRKR